MSYNVGDVVFAQSGPTMYRAKVEKLLKEHDKIKYYIHYFGWNKNWDEWKVESELIDYNEENAAKIRKKNEHIELQTRRKELKKWVKNQNKPRKQVR
eukprot:UN29415